MEKRLNVLRVTQCGKMEKRCVICGTVFLAPPSSKKVTCSTECRSKRASLAARRCGRKWNEESKKKRAADPSVIEQITSIQRLGSDAAIAIPEGQRGPQNRGSKVWELIDPDCNHIAITNLLDWARNNYTLFEPPVDDVDAAASRVARGFMAIASSMRGVKSRARSVYHYKGWGLARLPEKGGNHD